MIITKEVVETTYQQLHRLLKGSFPHLSTADIDDSLRQVREANDFTFKGLSREEVIDGVTEILKKKQSALERRKARAVVGPAESESPAGPDCPICCDSIDERPEVLDCGHEFHKRCIDCWFKEKHQCPLCRDLALPSDEFPKLK